MAILILILFLLFLLKKTLILYLRDVYDIHATICEGNPKVREFNLEKLRLEKTEGNYSVG